MCFASTGQLRNGKLGWEIPCSLSHMFVLMLLTGAGTAQERCQQEDKSFLMSRIFPEPGCHLHICRCLPPEVVFHYGWVQVKGVLLGVL